MIEFDLNGRKLALDETVVRELRERALAGAGSSSTLNDARRSQRSLDRARRTAGTPHTPNTKRNWNAFGRHVRARGPLARARPRGHSERSRRCVPRAARTIATA